MKKMTYLQVTLIAIILISSLILFSSTGKSRKIDRKEPKELCCKKTEIKPINNEMMWESLFHQFFSLTGS